MLLLRPLPQVGLRAARRDFTITFLGLVHLGAGVQGVFGSVSSQTCRQGSVHTPDVNDSLSPILGLQGREESKPLSWSCPPLAKIIISFFLFKQYLCHCWADEEIKNTDSSGSSALQIHCIQARRETAPSTAISAESHSLRQPLAIPIIAQEHAGSQSQHAVSLPQALPRYTKKHVVNKPQVFPMYTQIKQFTKP